jgi:hypothetical protein
VPPQPSPAVPHAIPSSAQVFGTHPEEQTLFTQVCPLGQVPQFTLSPVQLLVCTPQFLPSIWQSMGPFVQTLLTQVCPIGHLPQSSLPPQRSLAVPHW